MAAGGTDVVDDGVLRLREGQSEAVPGPAGAGPGRSCLFYATLSVLLALSWQFLTVHYNFGDNWTALFHTGVKLAVPPSLEFENVYRFPRTFGYDAQFYHYIAHSPLSPEEFSKYVDGPTLRWRRILVPALAHLLAFGRSEWVDTAFLTVTLGFLFLGSYWLSVYAVRAGRHPAWGLGYLLVPATMIAIERLTIDMALVTLCVGYVLYAEDPSPWKSLAILVAAPLVRETGLLLCLSHALFCLGRRQWRRMVLSVAASMPFLVWTSHVNANALGDGTHWTGWIPLAGLYQRSLRPVMRLWRGPEHAIASALDYLAFLGVCLALALVLYLIWKHKMEPVVVASAIFMLAISLVENQKVWGEAYAFGRLVSPVLIWLAMLGLSLRRWWLCVPLLAFLPRVGAQLATHLPGIVRGMAGL